MDFERNKRVCQGFGELPPPNNATASSKRRRGFGDSSGRFHGGGGGGKNNVKKIEQLCNCWTPGNCGYGDKCKFLRSWCVGDSFSLLTELEGHEKCLSALFYLRRLLLGLPCQLDQISFIRGGKDETLKIWDCQSGQCAGVIKLGGEVGCMLSEGPWLFVGISNAVKAWNMQTTTDLSLTGPIGVVYALVVGNDLLFAGTQDGTILAWRFIAAANCFEPVATLKGHTLAVITMVVRANRLYSGSVDHSIRVWSLETLQCVQTLLEHTSVVVCSLLGSVSFITFLGQNVEGVGCY